MMMNQTRDPLHDLFETMGDDRDDDSGAALTEALLHYYGLTKAEGLITSATDDDVKLRSNMIDLLNDSLYYAGMTIAQGALRFGEHDEFQPHHLDDHQDYDNAAADQIAWILETFQEHYEDMMIVDRVLALLNKTRDDLESGDELGGYAFVLGYADHFTPISHLMLGNSEED